jgi:hypothetical protein
MTVIDETLVLYNEREIMEILSGYIDVEKLQSNNTVDRVSVYTEILRIWPLSAAETALFDIFHWSHAVLQLYGR